MIKNKKAAETSFPSGALFSKKKGAMEMSVGTIVTIVLLMAVLVLGLVLVRGIFKSASGAVDLTDEQLRSEIEGLFSEDTSLVVFPSSRELTIKQGESDEVGVGIKNLGESTTSATVFSYVVTPIGSDCGISPAQLEKWMSITNSRNNLEIPIGSLSITRIDFTIPAQTPKCTARFEVKAKADGVIYGSEEFKINVKV